MSSEVELVLNVWEVVRDHLPYAKRSEIAKDLMYAFAEWFDATDLATLADEDPDLNEAYEEVFPSVDDEPDEDL